MSTTSTLIPAESIHDDANTFTIFEPTAKPRERCDARDAGGVDDERARDAGDDGGGGGDDDGRTTRGGGGRGGSNVDGARESGVRVFGVFG